ncbi:hypothetical protein CTI12_AA310390 [Artemisia annua]|uniref:Uncharacterized protein n=1 Tax=Artemisia annua TaxID=35608 RepID=A0A2U1N3E1_ARTAN|nr:hypothetical protein CTI12_AA310390 [Artemisia annua]
MNNEGFVTNSALRLIDILLEPVVARKFRVVSENRIKHNGNRGTKYPAKSYLLQLPLKNYKFQELLKRVGVAVATSAGGGASSAAAVTRVKERQAGSRERGVRLFKDETF